MMEIPDYYKKVCRNFQLDKVCEYQYLGKKWTELGEEIDYRINETADSGYREALVDIREYMRALDMVNGDLRW